jgi:hypothetical protein
MILYITAEDVFGDGAPERPGPRPLHRIPETVAGLYDLGLRHHVRPAVMAWPAADGFESAPDWKLDRLAIRIALYGREKLGVEPGERVAVFGRLHWLWPVVDFAAMGFGAVPVGIEHDVPDEVLAGALAESRPRVVYATDPESAERVLKLAGDGALGGATVVAEGLPESDRVLSVERLLDLGSILDTAERAQSFRAVSRQIAASSDALGHVAPSGLTRLTHAEAMKRVEPALRARPALPGDVAYVAGPRVDLSTRLALAAFVGDGHTTTVLGQLARIDKDIQELKPHKMLLSGGGWLETACREQGPRWPAGLDRPWARRRLLDRLGGRLRWIETPSAVGDPTARALDAAGVTVHTSTNLTVH